MIEGGNRRKKKLREESKQRSNNLKRKMGASKIHLLPLLQYITCIVMKHHTHIKRMGKCSAGEDT